MHDTILLQRISEELDHLCKSNALSKVRKISVIVGEHSHINEDNLYEHLIDMNGDFFGPWTNIDIKIEDLKDQTAILSSIEGEIEDEEER
jgi:Zn finger protein HypA/HybF involved in hydrogenase expression